MGGREAKAGLKNKRANVKMKRMPADVIRENSAEEGGRVSGREMGLGNGKRAPRNNPEEEAGLGEGIVGSGTGVRLANSLGSNAAEESLKRIGKKEMVGIGKEGVVGIGEVVEKEKDAVVACGCKPGNGVCDEEELPALEE